MKKDKEWALKELESKIIKNEVRFYTDGFNTGIDLALSIVAQIENPKTETLKPLVVPKDLGKWLSEQSLGDEEILLNTIKRLDNIWVNSGFEYFITSNKKALIEVILGLREYEVEKEKLYYIKFSENQYALRYNDNKIDSVLVTDKLTGGRFTEEQIKKINPNLMALAVEAEDTSGE